MISQMELHKIYIESSATDTFKRRTCIKTPFDKGFVHFSGGTFKQQKSETVYVTEFSWNDFGLYAEAHTVHSFVNNSKKKKKN